MILLVCAMIDEAKDLIGNLTKITTSPFIEYDGRINDQRVFLVISGIGKTNAAAAVSYMLAKHKFDLIINFGFAGANKLELAHPYLVTEATYHDFDLTIFNYQKGQVPSFPTWFIAHSIKGVTYPSVPLYTGDSFSVTAITNDAYLADMEGAAVFQTAHIYKTPVIGLKIVSDVIGTNTQETDYKASEQELSVLLALHVNNLLKEVKII